MVRFPPRSWLMKMIWVKGLVQFNSVKLKMNGKEPVILPGYGLWWKKTFKCLFLPSKYRPQWKTYWGDSTSLWEQVQTSSKLKFCLKFCYIAFDILVSPRNSLGIDFKKMLFWRLIHTHLIQCFMSFILPGNE